MLKLNLKVSEKNIVWALHTDSDNCILTVQKQAEYNDKKVRLYTIDSVVLLYDSDHI